MDRVAPISWLDEDEAAESTTTAQSTLDLSNRQLTHANLKLLPGSLT